MEIAALHAAIREVLPVAIADGGTTFNEAGDPFGHRDLYGRPVPANTIEDVGPPVV